MHSFLRIVIPLLLLYFKIVSSSTCINGTDNSVPLATSIPIEQTFIAPITGNLRQVVLAKTGSSATGTVDVVLVANGVSIIASPVALTATSSTYQASFTFAPVTSGSLYKIIITPTNSTTLGLSKGNYSDGNAILNSVTQNYDLAFSLCFSAIEYQSTIYHSGDSRQAAAFDSDNNIFLAGTLSQTVNISSNGTYYYTGGTDGFVSKYDNTPQHNLLWWHTFAIDLQNWKIGVFSNGDLLFVGTWWSFNQYCASVQDGGDIVVIRLNATDGSVIWTKCFVEYGSQYIMSLAVIDDNIFMTGTVSNKINLGCGDLANWGSSLGSFVGKLNSTGDCQWSRAMINIWLTTSSNTYANTIAIAGTMYNDFAALYASSYNTGNGTILMKLSVDDGSTVWLRTIPGQVKDELQAVDTDTNGEIAVAGTFSTSYSIDSVPISGTNGVLFAKFTSNGTCLWANSYMSSTTELWYQDFITLRIGQGNDIFVTGHSCSSCSLTLANGTLPANSGFIISFTSDGQFLWQDYFAVDQFRDSTVFTTQSSATMLWTGVFHSDAGNPTTMDGTSYTPGSIVHVYGVSEILPSPSPSPSVTPSRSPSVTPSITPSISVSSAATPRKKSNAGAIAGGVVGGVGAVAIGAVLVVFLILRRKKNSSEKLEDVEMKRESNNDTNKRDSTNSPKTLQSLSDDKGWKIDKSEIQMGQELGRGAFGVVYKCNWRNTECVIKLINLNQSNEAVINSFIREAHNVKNLRNHTNICAIFGVCADPVGIVMEYVEGGSLLSCLANEKIILTPKKVIKFAKDIASGMSHLHAESIIHLDLACRNLLVSFGANDVQTVKITDFGLSRIMDSDIYNASVDSAFPVRWTAPETLNMRLVSRASDVWSFAVTLWEIVERKVPYYNLPSNKVAEFVSDGGRLPRPTKVEIPDELWELMQECWSKIPENRPSFQTIYARLKSIEDSLNAQTTSEIEKKEPQKPVKQVDSNLDDNESGYQGIKNARQPAYGNSSLTNPTSQEESNGNAAVSDPEHTYGNAS